MEFRKLRKNLSAWEPFSVGTNCLWSGTLWLAESLRVLSWVSIRPRSAGAGSLETGIKKKKVKKNPCCVAFLSWIYNVSFNPPEPPSRTAARIVSECGLMDVGLEIKEINPRRVCLIFKSHLTFLSCVSALSGMSVTGEGGGGVAGSEWARGLLSELKPIFAFITEKTPQRWGGTHTHRHSLQGGTWGLHSISGKTPSPSTEAAPMCVCVYSVSVSGLMADSTTLKTDQFQQNLLSPAPSGPHWATAKTYSWRGKLSISLCPRPY